VLENFLRLLQHAAQEEMNALSMHGMVFTGCILAEILPTYFPVLAPSVAVSE
jgi:hypothetical protein